MIFFPKSDLVANVEKNHTFQPLRCERVKKNKDETSAKLQVEEAKLTCDVAKAYDQSDEILKGEGWKINFRIND